MDYIIGTIMLLPYTFAPMDMMKCTGQTLSVSQYAALFSLIGNTYGGDGKTTFCLPNMIGFEPIPYLNCYMVIEGFYPTRD
jgi:microcystin-dependent protein